MTGAGSATGRAVGLELAADSESAIVVDLGDAPLTRLLEEIRAAGVGAKPQEVSALVCFLATDAASSVSGSHHLVDGGHVAQ